MDLARMPIVVHAIVEAHEAGLLFVDGKLMERLPAGRHAFWAVGRTVKIAKVDTRPTPLEVTAQEILTKDRVGIRVTLTAFTRVVDPQKAVLASGDVANTVYRLVQFAIREAVAVRTLDEILAARDTIDREIRAVGVVRYDETRLSEVNLKLDGWISKLHVDSTGQAVRRGQPLLDLYSPELVATGQEYLLALKTREQVASSTIADAREFADRVVDAARQRLRLWDLAPEDITALDESKLDAKPAFAFDA
jgi:hypothetical protein